jgi:hypothetical protein
LDVFTVGVRTVARSSDITEVSVPSQWLEVDALAQGVVDPAAHRRIRRDGVEAGGVDPRHLAGLRQVRAGRGARHNGTAPVPVWSSNRHRHRLSRTGNRQLNAALHRIAITQAHYHPQARELLQRRRAAGDTKAESIRVLKRRLSDVVYRALLADIDRADTRTKATVTAA